MARNSIADIAAVVARKQKISKKEAADIVAAFFRIITEGLHEDRLVKVRGLGTFKVTTVKPRESVNINTGERVVIEGHDKISFVPDNVMKEFVNKPFAQFTTVPVNDGVNFESIDAASDAEERKIGIQNDIDADTDTEDADAELTDEENEQADEQIASDEGGEDEAVLGTDAPSSLPEGQLVDSVIISTGQNTPSTSQEEMNTTEREVVGIHDLSNDTDHATGENGHESLLPQDGGTNDEPEKATDVAVEPPAVEQQNDNNAAEQSACDEDNVSREYFDEQMRACRHRCNRNLIMSFVLLVVGLVAGFFIGGYFMTMKNIDKPVAKIASVKKPVPKVAAPVKQDSVKDSLPKADTIATEVEKPTPKPEKMEPKTADEADAEVADDDLPADIAKLNADRRLRFGAYEITGVDRVVRLKKGQTMQSFSNKTLGKDMVVYFQVLNGVDDAKPGDKMKVPKIRLKKQYRKH